jgi:hypothetical protein
LNPPIAKPRVSRCAAAAGWLAVAASCFGPSCAENPPLGRTLVAPDQIAAVNNVTSPWLKAHMKDGRLVVFSNWSVAETTRIVSGQGQELDVNRNPRSAGWLNIRLDDVALFETNAPIRTSPSLAAMAVVTGASLLLTGMCIVNPKACFGSCPTFYVSDGTRPVLQAEGFSDSIAPALEATDVDALFRARPQERNLQVRMTNEALETHVVKAVEILAVERPTGGRVFHAAGDGFYGARRLRSADHCEAPEGSCEEALRAFDGKERFSPADNRNLAAREDLTLTFSQTGAPSPSGLVIAARQTLLTTFLLYQGLAYLGTQATAALSALERDSSLRARVEETHRLLGGIQVQMQAANGAWKSVGEAFETGPIAADVHLVRLPPLPPGSVRIRLQATRGDWRIDWVALADLGPRLVPARITAGAIAGTKDDGRKVTVSPGETIVTLPGDSYELTFELPEHPERLELFLSSRGYYLEWIREQWLAEESSMRAAMMLYTPSLALRVLAPAYKKQEANMEKLFWGSRYARP